MSLEPQTDGEVENAAQPVVEIKTAEEFIRQALADAARFLDRAVDPKTGNPNHIAIAHYLGKFPAVVFLEALRRRDPQEADRLAAWVQQAMEDGETAGELNWQWSRQIADGHPMTWIGGDAENQPPIPADLSTAEITTRDGRTQDVLYVPTRTPGLVVTQALTGSFDGATWKPSEGRWGITHEATLLRVRNWDYPLDVAQSVAARLGELDVDWTQTSRHLWSAIDWTLWGHGLNDVAREPIATAMVEAIPADEIDRIVPTMLAWRARRGWPASHEEYAKLRDEIERLTAEVERLREAGRIIAQSSERFFRANADKAEQIERLQAQYDQAVEDWTRNDEQTLAENQRLTEEVFRLREQLAAQTEQVERTRRAERRSIAVVLTGMLDELEAAYVGEVGDGPAESRGKLHAVQALSADLFATSGPVELDGLESGSSSSEVEAPQPASVDYAMGDRIEWNTEADEWLPGLVTGFAPGNRLMWVRLDENGKYVLVSRTNLRPSTGESSISRRDEGRPSGSERLAPRWSEGDIALDRTDFVQRRFETGWRTWPRETGVQYSDADMEAGLGPLLRLAEVPAETDNLGHVPHAAAQRVRQDAAQAARSEATPRVARYLTSNCHRCGHTYNWHATNNYCVACGCEGFVDAPFPSLRKEGEGTNG